MSNYFLDTSALAKRYVLEAGSVWVRSLTHPASGNVLIIADITTVEMFSLLSRRVREGAIQASNATLLDNAFLLDAANVYLTVPLDGGVLAQARVLIGQDPLRALDAIQLASAQRAATILAEAITFVTSDRPLLAAANGEGMPTEDPLAQP